MCRTKSDRQTLIRALKRIANPPESVAGQAAYAYGEQEYNRTLILYIQRVASHALGTIEHNRTGKQAHRHTT